MSGQQVFSARGLRTNEDILRWANNELIPWLRKMQSVYKLISGALITGGPGAPTANPPTGVTVALYLRNDGGAGTSLYLYRAGAWAAVA